MSRLSKSAAYRVAITYSAAFALAIAILGMVLYLVFHRELLRQLDDQLRNESIGLTDEFKDGGLSDLIQAITEREQAGLSGEMGYALFDQSSTRIAGRMVTERPAPDARNIVFIDPKEGPDPARAHVTELPGGLTLVVAADREPLEHVDQMMLSFLGVALLAVVCIGSAGALVLGSYLRRRLGGITQAAEGIMAGDLTQRMTVSHRGDEFDRLSVTLNAMLDRIGELMDNVRQMSGDLAHDMRTPLSRLRTRLEAALPDKEGEPLSRPAVESALAQTDEILSLFGAILRLSEVESGRLKRTFADFDFTALVTDLCESFAPAMEDSGRSLTGSVEPGLGYKGDRQLIAQALVNLLDNAQKHTQPGTRISVGLARDDNGISLAVADNGPGVPASDRARITQRFIRLEAARSTAGNGLGLALVAAIAKLHGASLTFRDNQPGLAIRLHFPMGETA